MAITGKAGQCVNVKKNKHSYLALESASGDITDTTDVKPGVNATDGKGREWKPTVVRRKKPKVLRLRLTAEKEVKDSKEVEPPDGGTVTVTLVNPAATVPVEVVYVEDNHP
jgi:hypothetical protein